MKNEIAELRAEILKLRIVGSQMANICFNWSQPNWVQGLMPQQRETLAALYKSWDGIERTKNAKKT